MGDTKDVSRGAGSYDVKLWCMVKGDNYTPYSLDPEIKPGADLIAKMDDMGFNTEQVRAIVTVRIIRDA